jgi:Na+/H+ antiporter NhaB
MKTVFTNDMVAHVFAQQQQQNGTSSNAAFSFFGSELKSYNTLIAKFVSSDFVLVNSYSYSVTTSNHISLLRSAISDNVFVATIYIGEVDKAFQSGAIDRAHFEKLAIAINTGTNLPSVATPNGQAAFLFLLTSSVAPLIGLSYGKMVKMAFPYTIVLGLAGLLGVIYFL